MQTNVIDPGATSIFLIGMMGAGKSTIGRQLARASGLRFIDCDRELEHRRGVSIATMFAVEGESVFRERESLLLDELTRQHGMVLATGGGVVLTEANRHMLQQRGLVIYLEASADEIFRRTRADTTRPLLVTEDPHRRIVTLLAEREPLYRACAHRTFRSPAGNPRKLVVRILAEPAVATLVTGVRPSACEAQSSAQAAHAESASPSAPGH